MLHVFTDLHEDYHRTTDDWQKINLDGFDRVTNFTVGIVTALANRPAPLTPDDAAAATAAGGVHIRHPGLRRLSRHHPRHERQSREACGWLGVRAGSPAEKAGLRGDDVITKIGEMDVPDLQAMTDALRSHKPGDIVEIVIRRGAQLTTVRATLGTRGG